MGIRLGILVLATSSLLFWGFSLAQTESVQDTTFTSINEIGEWWSIYENNLSTDIFFQNREEEIVASSVDQPSEDRQNMTGVDNNIESSSWLECLSSDIVLLSEKNIQNVGSGESTGEINSWIISQQIPHLIFSEVYYDGTDEWIEITNRGEGGFYGDIVLSWAKSTPISLSNISLFPLESKIFGDTLAQISWISFVGKTGLGLSIVDTAQISLQMMISGQIEDSFFVDQYRVNKYNDKKTSFEKIGNISTWVQPDRVTNAQSGYIINPGIYLETGINITNVSFAPTQSWGGIVLPISCDSVDQRDLIKINEIFPGNEKYPPYIELAINEDIYLDMLSISGNYLSTGLDFPMISWGEMLENNTFLLLSATGFRKEENLPSVQNSDFSLLSTWNWLLITIGSWQIRQVLDIVYSSWDIVGKSLYFGTGSHQCARIFDAIDDFSPGFKKEFLRYFPVTTLTKIEYLPAITGNQSSSVNCPTSETLSISTGNIQVLTDTSSIENTYTISILDVEYDPPGSDTNNEKITLLAKNSSGDQTPLDLSNIFRLKVNGTNKTLPWILPMDVPTTFTKTFGFPNSTTSGQDVVILLTYNDHIFSTYTYNPQKLSPQKQQELTTTGYTVSSVLDGDTFRIKYQGKTQNIRLLGIDAPESNKTRYKYLECFGTEAKNYLKTLIDKKKITFQFDVSQDQKDVYDRLLAYVFLDGKNINQTMIEDGYAKEYTYKTPYNYQLQFRQAEQLAQENHLGLWNESTCWVSLSWVQLTGDLEATGTKLNLSGVQFTISYVLPDPKGSDTAEELGLRIDYGMSGQIDGIDRIDGIGSNPSNPSNPSITSPQATQFNLSQWFSLRIGETKKKIERNVVVGQENILSWSLGLVNKAACVSLWYEEKQLTMFCYGKPKEGQKIYSSDQWLEETPQQNLDILNGLQLKRIDNQLCIWYKEQSFLCKRIPASKAEIKTIQEQKLYKWFASLIKQYIISNWKSLYYNTPVKQYFDLVAQNKKLIGQWISQVDIYGQRVVITDMKQQLLIMKNTLPGVVAMFEWFDGL